MKELFRILKFVRPYWHLLAGSVLLMACVGAMQGLTALLIKPVLDSVLNPSAPDLPVPLFTVPLLGKEVFLQQLAPSFLHNIWTIVAFGILTVFFLKGVCDYLGNYLVNRVGCSAIMDLRQTIFENVLRQDSEFYELNTTGKLMSSIMNDIEKIQVATSHILADWLRQSFSAVALLYVVLQTDWKLALVSITLLPFVLIPTARIGKRIRRSTRKAQDDTANLNQILQETLSGHLVVKSFGTEAYEGKRFYSASKKLRSSNLRYVAQQSLTSPIIEFFGALTIVGLLTYARTQIKAGSMTTGEFMSFVIALLMLYEPVKRLTGIHNIFQQALGASQKVFEYLDRQVQVREKPDAVRLERFEQGILFDNINFRYPTSPDGFLLEGLTLEVKAGQIVAIVGPSGAGKSTLANLVPRFYDVTQGRVLIDGKDVKDLTLASLRSKIGIVAQDTFLFNDTVSANISYGHPEADRKTIEEAARNALAEEFILAMPDGYETIIGERGTRLSGGQRQRIAIARAILRNAPILILDEATSHLDTESELLVQRALANLMSNRTVIVIAHRLSTIRRADKIVVIDRGRICEIGSHDELIGSGGVYQRLHELQFLEADPLVNP